MHHSQVPIAMRRGAITPRLLPNNIWRGRLSPNMTMMMMMTSHNMKRNMDGKDELNEFFFVSSSV